MCMAHHDCYGFLLLFCCVATKQVCRSREEGLHNTPPPRYSRGGGEGGCKFVRNTCFVIVLRDTMYLVYAVPTIDSVVLLLVICH